MVQCAPGITMNFWGPKFRFLTVLLHFQQFQLAWNSNEDTWTQGADGWLALWLLKLRQRRDHSWCHCPDAHWMRQCQRRSSWSLSLQKFGCSVRQNYRTAISSRCLIDRLADDCGGPLMQDLSSQNLAQARTFIVYVQERMSTGTPSHHISSIQHRYIVIVGASDRLGDMSQNLNAKEALGVCPVCSQGMTI